MSDGIETFVCLGPDPISTNSDLFWGLFNATRVLFTAEVVTWAAFIGGCSAAGWLSETLPKWLTVLGLVPTDLDGVIGIGDLLLISGRGGRVADRRRTVHGQSSAPSWLYDARRLMLLGSRARATAVS